MDKSAFIDDSAWERIVKNMLRAEMVRRGVSYDQMIERLCALGVRDNVPNLRNKIARGRFTAPFFAQCMVALGVELLQFPKLEDIVETTRAHDVQVMPDGSEGTETEILLPTL